MKEATYTLIDNSKVTVEYDETAPCRICGLPVVAASMGGTDVCPWCDCGIYRDGSRISFDHLIIPERLKEEARRRQNELVKKTIL